MQLLDNNWLKPADLIQRWINPHRLSNHDPVLAEPVYAPLGTAARMTCGVIEDNRPAEHVAPSRSLEGRLALFVERLDAFLEVVRLAETAVAVAFEFDGDGEGGILGIVEQLLRRSLGQG